MLMFSIFGGPARRGVWRGGPYLHQQLEVLPERYIQYFGLYKFSSFVCFRGVRKIAKSGY